MRFGMNLKEGGEKRNTIFSLIGNQRDPSGPSLDCMRLSGNAAALCLPSPALAARGPFQLVNAEFSLLATDHLVGWGIRRVSWNGPPPDCLISSSSPVDIDWDFKTGDLHLEAGEEVSLGIRGRAHGEIRLDGKRLDAGPDGEGLLNIRVGPGRHVLEGAKPGKELLSHLAGRFEDLLSNARRQRALMDAGQIPAGTSPLPPLEAVFSTPLGESVTDLTVIPSGREEGDALVCAAAGRILHVLGLDGRELRKFAADGAIRVLRYWKEHDLLLAGCADEKVIAFDRGGRRMWVFVSEMDPAVYRAAKTYWFKSAPGHEGIHGLHTGVFLEGKSQAFVGSACTLEILDEKGTLVKRLPQFWGKVSHFAIIDDPGGGRTLLASRKYNGVNTVARINNRTLDPRPRGFNTVPPGSTHVGGWSSMNRHHLFYEDLDGDGTREVVSEINGTWNRVTVWRADGRALHDASFGPGDRIPSRNMRDLEVVDLDGDGKKEILAATSRGMVVALDHECRKVWARRLESPPEVLKWAAPEPAGAPWIFTGCEDGSVVVLDGRGNPIRRGRISGRPTCIEGSAAVVLLATDRGEVKGFRAGP
jgi:hypothetical protein